MSALMFAQALVPAIVGQWLIVALVVAGVIGIFLVVTKQFGITVPSWLVAILLIVVGVLVGVVAIKFLVGIV